MFAILLYKVKPLKMFFFFLILGQTQGYYMLPEQPCVCAVDEKTSCIFHLMG